MNLRVASFGGYPNQWYVRSARGAPQGELVTCGGRERFRVTYQLIGMERQGRIEEDRRKESWRRQIEVLAAKLGSGGAEGGRAVGT